MAKGKSVTFKMPDLLAEATATFNEILRVHKLNAELLEMLLVTTDYLRNYAEKYNIPLPDSSTFYSLINKAEALVEEITSEIPAKYLLGDEFLQRKRTDTDFTKPEIG